MCRGESPTRAAAAAVATLALAVLLAAAAAPADARRVRVFAVGPKLSLEWLESRQTFHDKLFALMDRRRRVPGAPRIQGDADEVAAHRLGPTDPARPVQTARDLVVLPEDVGLFAALTGQRGAQARSVPADAPGGGLVQAIASILVAYAPVNSYYASRFPSLAARAPQTRLLLTALTDQFGRVALETFAELADRYDVYLVGGVNMAQEWKVVCADRATFRPPPGVERCDEEDAGKVATLRAPDEPARDYAYEATTPKVSNMSLVFDPEGRLIAKQAKSYLTPVELPGQLDLTAGEVSGLDAVPTPVGRLGFVISKDAFVPDVAHKLDQRRVDLLVQPEFFVNDTVAAPGMFASDTLKSSGWSRLLQQPSFRALAMPSMTGNVYEFSADLQQLLAVKPRGSRTAAGHLVGQPSAPGMAVVSPWIVPDPLRPDEPFGPRRERLSRASAQTLPLGDGPPCPTPGMPGPCKGGQVEGVLYADFDVGDVPARRAKRRRKQGRTVFSVSRPLAAAPREQRNVSLAARGATVWAAFEERRGGRDRLLMVRSRDGGRRWSRPYAPLPDTNAERWWPSLAVGPDGRVWLAWQENGGARQFAMFASSADGRRFTTPRGVDAGAAAALQWKPSIASGEPGRAVIAWIDERERSADDGLPQAHVYFARVEGERAEPARRLDAGDVDPKSLNLDHAWAPHVAAQGARTVVTWLDFRTYDWRPYARESSDGAVTFGPERAVTDAPPVFVKDPNSPPEFESLDDSPQAAMTDRGPIVAFTDFRKTADSRARPHQLFDVLATFPGQRNVQVDPHGGAQVVSFAPALAPLRGGQALIAWQDHARGDGDVLVRRLAPGGASGRPRRVDDGGRRGWNAWRPALALSRGRAVVAWEDDRDGPRQVFFARAPLPRLR